MARSKRCEAVYEADDTVRCDRDTGHDNEPHTSTYEDADGNQQTVTWS